MSRSNGQPKTSLQFKMALMFFVVMVISAGISLSLLGLIFTPIMRSNVETQMSSFAASAKILEGKGYSSEEIISILNTSGYSVKKVGANDPNIVKHQDEIKEKGFYMTSTGIVPAAVLYMQLGDEYFRADSFNNENVYLVVNFLTIVTIIICIILGTVITGFVSRTILQPIRDLSRATSEVARGNFNVRVRVPSDNEYGLLARNFNKMAEEVAGIETLRGDFISNVSHEFKTPLASIQGFAKLLQDETLSPEDRREYTQIIIDESARLSKLSTNILNLTKLENQTTIGKKKRFAIDEQIRKIILMLEPEWSKKDIELDIDLEDVFYVGNEDLMGQIWQNIINNAIKFTPQGGKIRVLMYRGAKGVVVKISDNGPGIPEDKIDKIFDKFYQGDRSRATEGNGLGLALVKRIIDLCKGKVSVQNLPEGGVVFIVELPYQTEQMA